MMWRLRSRWTQWLAILVSVVAMTVFAVVPALAEGAISIKEPFDTIVFVPCANGGAGEEVQLTGTIHDLFHLSFDNAGGVHVKAHRNPQGVTGVGLTTGDSYRATGVTQFTFNAKVGVQDTFVNNFRIIGRGRGNNLLAHELVHITVNANGTITTMQDRVSIDCK